MRFRLFGPSQEEIDEVASDLIARHGLNAHDEAVHLAEIAQLLPRSLRQRTIYELAAIQIERSFETALERLRERSTGNFAQHLLKHIAILRKRLNRFEITQIARLPAFSAGTKAMFESANEFVAEPQITELDVQSNGHFFIHLLKIHIQSLGALGTVVVAPADNHTSSLSYVSTSNDGIFGAHLDQLKLSSKKDFTVRVFSDTRDTPKLSFSFS